MNGAAQGEPVDLMEAKLAFLDVETTGLSPAMGDRIVEIGIVACQGEREIERISRLVNPDRPIPLAAHHVHGISDKDVTDNPRFNLVAQEVGATLQDAWIVGHNVRFDVGFIAMEMASAGQQIMPLGCLDTCQLASAVWDHRVAAASSLFLRSAVCITDTRGPPETASYFVSSSAHNLCD